MNRGKKTSIPVTGGYTFVEVLIFLAVSASMFFAAMIFISGQQNKAQFTNSVRDFETKLSDIANDVATGYYTKPVNFTCSEATSAGNRVPVVSYSATNQQGTNSDCIFAGTVVKFAEDSTNRSAFMQFTMAGLRTDSNGNNVKALDESNPRPVYEDSSELSNAVTIYDLNYGARVYCVNVGTGCSAQNNAAIGFYTTFSQTNIVTGQGAGIQTDVLSYRQRINFNDNVSSTSAKLASTNIDTTQLNQDRITICLQSGSTKQYALVRLGGSGGLTISSEIKGYSGDVPPCT